MKRVASEVMALIVISRAQRAARRWLKLSKEGKLVPDKIRQEVTKRIGDQIKALVVATLLGACAAAPGFTSDPGHMPEYIVRR